MAFLGKVCFNHARNIFAIPRQKPPRYGSGSVAENAGPLSIEVRLDGHIP